MFTDGGSILINALVSIMLLCEIIGKCKLTYCGKNNVFYTCVTGIASEELHMLEYSVDSRENKQFYNTNNSRHYRRLHCCFFTGRASLEVLRAVLIVSYKTIPEES